MNGTTPEADEWALQARVDGQIQLNYNADNHPDVVAQRDGTTQKMLDRDRGTAESNWIQEA